VGGRGSLRWQGLKGLSSLLPFSGGCPREEEKQNKGDGPTKPRRRKKGILRMKAHEECHHYHQNKKE
jgi:hypothetical protein